MSVADRLATLGLTLPKVVPPLAAYQPAVRSGNYIYTAGQLPMADGELLETGCVGDDPECVTPERATELAAVCGLNALAAIASLDVSLDTIRIVKVVGFVAATPTFTGHPGVINGASNLFQDALGDRGVHARSAVGVSSLPLGAPVEVEALAEIVDS